jgi:hypothetical protein
VSERPAAPDRSTPPDWLDHLLADDASAHAHEYIDDAGFTARVIAALPAPAVLPAWRKPAVTALWAAVGLGLAFALPSAAVDVAREAFKLFAAKPFSLSEVLAVIALAGAGTWTTAIIAWKRGV